VAKVWKKRKTSGEGGGKKSNEIPRTLWWIKIFSNRFDSSEKKDVPENCRKKGRGVYQTHQPPCVRGKRGNGARKGAEKKSSSKVPRRKKKKKAIPKEGRSTRDHSSRGFADAKNENSSKSIAKDWGVDGKRQVHHGVAGGLATASNKQ